MLGAGLLAKNAVEAGLAVLPYIKTSLSPGSGVVFKYLVLSGKASCRSPVCVKLQEAQTPQLLRTIENKHCVDVLHSLVNSALFESSVMSQKRNTRFFCDGGRFRTASLLGKTRVLHGRIWMSNVYWKLRTVGHRGGRGYYRE